MRDRPRSGAARAFTDGIGRVAAAPAVLAGTIGIVGMYGAAHDVRHAIGALLLWAFLSGGILDRYARRRATRARGFFGACGTHFGAMTRLGAIILMALGAFHWIVGRGFGNPYVHQGAFIVAIVLALFVTYAQVRIAVEDRRSAMGALLAGARFVGRNPASLILYLIFAAAGATVMLVYERLVPTQHTGTWTAFAAAEGLIAADTAVALASFASGIALFQGRLAHAGYTAAPPILWPESPAAEAIANASPTGTP